MIAPFSTRTFFRGAFFAVTGTVGASPCRILFHEVSGLQEAGQLVKRPGRQAVGAIKKHDFPDRPAPHTEVTVDGVVWRIDGEPTDSGDVWEFRAITDQRAKGR